MSAGVSMIMEQILKNLTMQTRQLQFVLKKSMNNTILLYI